MRPLEVIWWNIVGLTLVAIFVAVCGGLEYGAIWLIKSVPRPVGWVLFCLPPVLIVFMCACLAFVRRR